MIYDKFEEAFIIDGINARTSYTEFLEDVEEEELAEIIAQDKVAHIMQVGNQINPVLSPWSNDSRGCIIHSRLFMHTFTKKPKDCHTKALEWLIKIYVTEEGVLGQFGSNFDYQGLIKIWAFEPINGIITTPVKDGGEFWRVSQPIEFAAAEI